MKKLTILLATLLIILSCSKKKVIEQVCNCSRTEFNKVGHIGQYNGEDVWLVSYDTISSVKLVGCHDEVRLTPYKNGLKTYYYTIKCK